MGFEEVPDIEKYRYGQFSLTPEEEKRLSKEAIEKEKEKMKQATKRLWSEKGEKAREETKKAIEKESKNAA